MGCASLRAEIEPLPVRPFVVVHVEDVDAAGGSDKNTEVVTEMAETRSGSEQQRTRIRRSVARSKATHCRLRLGVVVLVEGGRDPIALIVVGGEATGRSR